MAKDVVGSRYPSREEGARFRAHRRWIGCIRVSVAVGAGNAAVTGCDYSEYPIEASFCDDWCRTLRRTPCDQEPENCIRDCEASLPSARCFERQVTLLDCYQQTAPEQLVCVDQGFQGQVRPMPEICTADRDALIECEAPRVKACIDACRALDAEDPVSADEAEAAEICPESPIPCERLCWEIDARAELLGEGIGDDADLTALGRPLITCARDGARSCIQNAAGAPPMNDGSGTSWTGLFLECAGLPASFDLFDD
jgi:hypothetical protein